MALTRSMRLRSAGDPDELPPAEIIKAAAG
jgi:hypothetical protein